MVVAVLVVVGAGLVGTVIFPEAGNVVDVSATAAKTPPAMRTQLTSQLMPEQTTLLYELVNPYFVAYLSPYPFSISCPARCRLHWESHFSLVSLLF